MKRKFLSLLLALCLLVGLMPTTAFATETAVASVTINGTTTEYDDFQNAIDAAEVGGTSVSPAVLKLLADIPYTEIDNPDYEQDSFMPAKIPATWRFGDVDESIKYVNLDMNSHSISNDVELWGTVMTISGNGTFNGTASQNSSTCCLALRPLSKITIENGTFNNAIKMTTDSETLTELTINDGTFNNGEYYSAVEVFGTVMINGGNFTADNTRMFRLGNGSLRITGGNFTCSTGVYLATVYDSLNWYPTLSLSGGTYTGGITLDISQTDGTVSYKLKDILAENKSYFDTDGKQITSGLDGYTISDTVSVNEGNITPTHSHTWDAVWSNDDTTHWHECNADACPITENSGKNGYGEHNYNREIVSDTYKASDADCTNPVVYYKSCVCGKTGTETFTSGSALNHSWKAEWETNSTHHWHECGNANCPITADSDKDDYGEHTYNQEVATATYKVSDADCTNPAMYYKSCVCGAKGTETFTSGQAAGHNYGTDWKSDAQNHWHECSCGAKSDETTHTAGDWIVDKAATATEKGNKHKECTVCDYTTETAEIPATGTTNPTDPDDKEDTTKPSEDNNPNTGVDEVPKTGDNSNMALWLSLMLASICGFIVLLFVGKKSKSER